MRGLDFNKHQTFKYAIFSLFFSRKNKVDKYITTKIASREVYIINNLKIKMLIEINVIILEKIDILISTFIA